MAMEDDGGKDGKDSLNRSRRDRLTKAAKQGYGPWADQSQRSRAAESASRVRQQLAAVSENAPRAPLMQQQRRTVIRKSTEDEPDLDSFLASKPPGSAQKKAQGHMLSIQAPSSASAPVAVVPKNLELRLSSHHTERAMAASAGARPKAAARPGGPTAFGDFDEPLSPGPDEDMQAPQASASTSRRPVETSEEEEEEDAFRERSEAPRARRASPDRSQCERSRSREERRQRQREERRKREEWRKQWREDKKRRTKIDQQRSRSRDEASRDSESSEPSKHREPMENQQNRALTWSALNSFGVTTPRDAQKKPVGQVSDADLDRRLREAAAENAKGGKLMSEAEVLAKMQKSRGKRR